MSSNSRAAALLAAFIASGCATTGRADGGINLAALQVTPQRGQSADQARRDRYECHNWAIEQSGETPPPASSDDDDAHRDGDRDRREERADRAITGAAIGGVLGGLFGGRGWHEHNRDVLAGAAVGAAVGAGTQGRDERDHKEAAAPPQSGYLRALSACLEGRGYRVELPAPPAKGRRS